ncbi:RNA polymerase sigma-70 factor [Prolixibacteraceae bacterium Z1-6]|uniref:RNA polymerase sigma-70 factor n=1 Tax=Draconibacterium aestuarii TaxID=2998507 RepID=A0A9X3F1M8_9BACT|nr:RNA polymerase sigma-70 factor [Prolixibacteraceae bacterium Z1-6]
MVTFDQIFQKYYHSLLLYGLKFISNDNDVNDILQEVFAVVWEKEKYKLETDHLKSYLYNSVRNGCLNYLRHQSVVQKHAEQEKVTASFNELHFYQSGEKSLIEKEGLEKIYVAINSLSDNYKEVIELSRFQGLKNKEIAEKLNIPLRTVETRLFRALSSLRKSLTNKQIYILMNLSLNTAN